MKAVHFVIALFALGASAGCHNQTASVLPKGNDQYQVIGVGPNEQDAYKNAESEARYTCEDSNRHLRVLDQNSVYQGSSKDERGKVEGTNVALAVLTGHSGKERASDDYKVTLFVECG